MLMKCEQNFNIISTIRQFLRNWFSPIPLNTV